MRASHRQHCVCRDRESCWRQCNVSYYQTDRAERRHLLSPVEEERRTSVFMMRVLSWVVSFMPSEWGLLILPLGGWPAEGGAPSTQTKMAAWGAMVYLTLRTVGAVILPLVVNKWSARLIIYLLSLERKKIFICKHHRYRAETYFPLVFSLNQQDSMHLLSLDLLPHPHDTSVMQSGKSGNCFFCTRVTANSYRTFFISMWEDGSLAPHSLNCFYSRLVG